MAQKDRKAAKESRLERTCADIRAAWRALDRTILGPLASNTSLVVCAADQSHEPQIACVDPSQGVVWANPHRRQELKAAEWKFVLAHMLLHLGLNHAAHCQGRDPFLWNVACDHTVDNFLHAFKIGTAPYDFRVDTAFAGLPEEEIYRRLAEDRRATSNLKTFAGPKRPDIVAGAKVSGYRHRTDYANLLAEGIRSGVERAVTEAGQILGQIEEGETPLWRPVENARRWVMNELPLLGPLAAQLKVIADGALCDRMNIRVAAVNAFLGEVYFHTKCVLTQEEILFVYVHELLHVALLHHTRINGRDPWIWNLACDFVINGWLVEMGVGRLPAIGGLYDPQLKGMSADEVYDLLVCNGPKCKKMRGFRGEQGDVLLDANGRQILRGDITMLDDLYRRCIASGLAYPQHGRGLVPAGLIEEIRSLFTPPVPWDVELAHWMDAHVPALRDPLRTYSRVSRRQGSTPDIPRPARYIPQEWKDACTFGVVLDTSGSMDRELLGRALGAIASYSEARDVPSVRLMLCDAAPYDRGIVAPKDLRGVFPIQGRGGTVLQPAINFLLTRPDFPATAPIMIITDGWCEEELLVPRDHCVVMPRKTQHVKPLLRTSAPVFQVLREDTSD